MSKKQNSTILEDSLPPKIVLWIHHFFNRLEEDAKKFNWVVKFLQKYLKTSIFQVMSISPPPEINNFDIKQ